MNKFIKRVQIAYNPATDEVICQQPVIPREYRSNPKLKCFDSLSEFQCYQKLKRVCALNNWHLEHTSIYTCSSFKWKIDFKITNVTLSQIENLGIIPDNTGSIYIEYKGILDKNFLRQMEQAILYMPLLTRSLLICSNSSNLGYSHYNARKQEMTIFPIWEVDALCNVMSRRLSDR